MRARPPRRKIVLRLSAAPRTEDKGAGTIEHAAFREQVEETGAPATGRLLRLAHALARAQRPDESAALAADALSEVTGGGVAAVYRACDEAARGLAAYAGPVPGRALEGFPALAARAAAGIRPLRAEPSELQELAAGGCHCAAAVAAPVRSRGKLLAVLVVGVPGADQLALHPQLVGTVADLLGASLVNALVPSDGDAERRLDTLTGLPNHRAFHDELDAQLRAAHADSLPLSLVLLDLDGLGTLVDERGRTTGDRALTALADAARAIAGADTFRIGGDEFALLLRTGSEEAARAGAAVSAALEQETGGLATASAGVAAFPADARTKDELVHQADLALLAAKRVGRARAVASRSDLEGAAARSSAEVHRAELHGLMTRKPVRDAVADELATLATGIRELGRTESPQEMLDAAADQLRALLGATACVVSRLENDALRDAAVVAPSPWVVNSESAYLLDDYPLSREAIEADEPRFASLEDPDVDPSEAYALREVGMQANVMLPLRVDGRPWGLVEIFDARPRTFGPGDVALAGLVVGHVESLLARFEQAEAVQRLYYETLSSLSNALEAKDDYTGDHAQAVGDLAVSVAQRVGLTGEDLNAVEFGAVLHDIGKIRIPEAILNKPGPLDDEEWEIMRAHPEAGERILAPIASLAPVLPIVRSSHERWDGAGYPDALAGEEIPLGARIVSVCDAYRAMIEPRPYRAARDAEVARTVLVENAGTQFDPACVDALLAELDALERRSDALTLNRPHHLRSA